MREFVEWKSRSFKPGDKFHKLTVLGTAKASDTSLRYALCQCDCGSRPFHARLSSLRTGNTKTCGCSKIGNFKHGLRWSPVYMTHVNMMFRCYSTKCKAFPSYGGRGITVCKRWHSLRNFIEDMEPTHEKGLSLERVDNDKGYSPKNCRWATMKEQLRNRRNVHMFAHNGKTLCLQEWADLTGVYYSTLRTRLSRGWSFERAVKPKKS
ncbi:hypothetical protein LCGC14_1702090 [marine sediment metagenome]|uniref:Uncharacterized protein n=1 Tax=marine sediment metagenome TaxID=412755 RepID=A0A0F9I593_9ZZZZ